MALTLVDSNVLLDILTADPQWISWSEDRLDEALSTDGAAINQIIFAEVSARFDTRSAADSAIAPQVARLDLPWDAAFIAGRAYVDYRRQGGQKRSPLGDFYIGAHAQVAGLTLLTRDAARYRTYFPDVRLIAP